ncbi:type II toxin-antitoxin system RelE/ParE family toxin [Variovorax sp. GT1P44]|uniref:type II toxin-antitoxin system RelE/ParE family toxin n=1 Tax=Variovorax sp. GT1P44 TaxID=3443742 RepID=UPI003F4778BE
MTEYYSGGIILAQWEIEYTDELGKWWVELSEAEQESIDASVRLLEERGPNLGFPHTSGIGGSRHAHMRELRIQHEGRPYRILYAFDPRRCAILLIGGDKTGNDRWYHEHVPVADKLYDVHVEVLRKEGLIDG